MPIDHNSIDIADTTKPEIRNGVTKIPDATITEIVALVVIVFVAVVALDD